ncbi:RDD family protein [Candidatus Poriferisodalis sp.]|uniref:RDD family protein n=1 Tax=Candidatus Poriferisodalis sp. TaxID=3101277 RepID=UPI003B02A7DE
MEPEQPPERDGSVSDFAAGPFRRLMAALIDDFFLVLILVFWPLVFVILVWWLFVLGRGQTPGKQLAGIFAVRRDGSRFGWGRMFIRENFRLLLWIVTFGFALVVDGALILLRKDRRSVTDLVAGSVLVYVPSE